MTGVSVVCNGEPREVAAGASLGPVVDELSPTRKGIAVAVNGEVVPRSRWDDTALAEGDRIEVLTAAQGG